MKPTIKITVLLRDRWEKTREWNLQLPACYFEREKAAEEVFHISNAPPEILNEWEQQILVDFPRTGLPSVSVNDVIIIQDHENPDIRHIAIVAGCGFTFH